MKTTTTYNNLQSRHTTESHSPLLLCDECAAALEKVDELIKSEVVTPNLSDKCAGCGKTYQEELEEQNESQDKMDDYEMAFNAQGPQDIYPAAVNVSADDSSVYELKRQYGKERLNLAPDYQRGNVWKWKQKSELIESILMGIPLPIMYFFQDAQGVKQVIDGKQRLTALFEFLDDKFTLSELPVLQNLKGKKFSDLSPVQQGKIEDYKLSINVIKPPTPDRIKFDIFDRVNRGGTRLNNQEMRNAIYQGKATKLLEQLKDSERFKLATSNSISPRVMKDRYMILRFLSFCLWRKKLLVDECNTLIEYKSDIDAFVGKAMEYLNRCSEPQLLSIADVFEMAMHNAYQTIGPDGFRISNYLEKERRTSVSMALFEVLSYLFSFEQAAHNKSKTQNLVRQLFTDEEFLNAITTPVDSSTKVTKRFEKIEALLQEL